VLYLDDLHRDAALVRLNVAARKAFSDTGIIARRNEIRAEEAALQEWLRNGDGILHEHRHIYGRGHSAMQEMLGRAVARLRDEIYGEIDGSGSLEPEKAVHAGERPLPQPGLLRVDGDGAASLGGIPGLMIEIKAVAVFGDRSA
jgi:hypothetical protein